MNKKYEVIHCTIEEFVEDIKIENQIIEGQIIMYQTMTEALKNMNEELRKRIDGRLEKNGE